MENQNLYPIYLDLSSIMVLVVGGGSVAERKVNGLRQCCAGITLVSPSLTPYLVELVTRGELDLHQRQFSEGDLVGVGIVYCATDQPDLNARIAWLCREQGILVNVADNQELSSFFVPSTLRRGPLAISVSTGGKSPLLARRIRELLETCLSSDLEGLALLLGEARNQLSQSLAEQAERQLLWEQLLTPELVKEVADGNFQLVRKQVTGLLASILKHDQ